MALVKAAPNSGKDKFVNILYNKLEYKEEDQQQIKKMLDAASDKNNVNLPEFVGDIKVAGAAFSIPHCEFEFQNVIYHHQSTTTTTKSNSVKSGTNTDKFNFKQRHFPTHQTMEQYIKHVGYTSFGEVCAAKRIFGTNEFDIPLPSFMELYVVSKYSYN